MKQVILAKHIGREADNQIRFWNYTNKTNKWYLDKESKYAVVNTTYGLQLVEIIGIAEVVDDLPVNADVKTFIDNKDLSEIEYCIDER